MSLYAFGHKKTSSLACLLTTCCLNKLGGDMMSPVVRAEKAADAEGSAPYLQESLYPVVTLRRQAWRLGMNKEKGNG
jgi:hypothetical protein